MTKDYKFLNAINSPDDLKKLGLEDLSQVSEELRHFIIDVVSDNPGHFGASLGVVELTVALHYVFKTPYDKLVWDVGHQAYGHKILTGRRDLFHTNRKYKGISGFPKPSESEYDAFGVGHSSTSISAALGMAVAAKQHKEEDRQVVAIIGDGSLTAGMAFEGLNNAGIENSNLLVILNDNNMAIDPNVGAMKEYLLDITTSRTYNKVKDDVWNFLGRMSKLMPDARRYAQKVENALKSMMLKQSNMFESLNFRYFGPVDGHDVIHLTKVLEDLKHIKGPKLLHVITTKGKGFKQAEINQTAYHSPGKFNKETGEILSIKSEKPLPPKFQDVFGETILELAKTNKDIVGITPAMPTGSSLKIMMDQMPERSFDVGISEQHAVTFSAGLAIQGMKPYCNIYSTFMQRAYDQVVHDVAIQNLNVVLCLDRGGLVGDDGATHHGVFDLAYLRNVPNMIVSAPMDESDLRNLMYTAQLKDHGPFSIRYPRGRGISADWKKEFTEIEIGKGRMLKDGRDLAILTIGNTGILAKEAIEILEKENYHIAHYDMRFVKPIDKELLHSVFKKFKYVITIEDGVIQGGFGSAVIEFMCDNVYTSTVKRLGIPDKFIEHGTQQELYKECGFDVGGIIKEVKGMVKKRVLSQVS
ncbi:MAG: 1-deoxy-D-xylulose-5-phosphate synthase [Bacteroidales bacterium]|nr:1-deoxy-D-xylulose-5-phosphate synthase [Bacteroidales bacterium]MCF8389595.1 1-deoxy-D-xylulose-5-phosphate synthase [Bacteroidales bacterium]